MPAFSPAFFEFLRELAANNDREWFTANKARFKADVEGPLKAFVAELAGPIAAIDPDVAVSAASVFRIYRDTRFSKDKAPYKTHMAAQFTRGAAKGPSATGYYLHLEPGRSFLAGGLYLPDPSVAAKVRAAIARHPTAWSAAKAEAGGLSAMAESLVRVPKPFPADHPLAEDLKRKGWIASRAFTEAEVTSGQFGDRVLDGVRRLAPLLRFLGDAAA